VAFIRLGNDIHTLSESWDSESPKT